MFFKSPLRAGFFVTASPGGSDWVSAIFYNRWR